MNAKKYAAEAIGTFWLTFAGCGSAVIAAAFPQVLACPETLPGGPIPVPMDHPIVAQTIEDCLTEAMDVDGFLEVLRGLRDGSIERVAIDSPEPSAFARGILNLKQRHR